MLSPEYLDQAGEKVASVYRQIEAEMLEYLARRMLAGDVSNQRSLTALELLAQSAAAPLLEIVGRHEADISAAVKLEVSDAIRRCSADDLRRIKRGLGLDMAAATTRQTALTVGGVARILERDNIDMAEGARDAFLQSSIWAVTQVNTGAMTTERALHMAVRRLERSGISVVQYRDASTGRQTVANKVDVAVRRHIRTQILQDGMDMTERILDQAGVELVEVSSHGGSRPSHAKWEGRVYSRRGEQVIDGVRYRDFKTACNWGDVADGIGGANCRHSYSAYFPGMARTYEPNPPHPSGMGNDEVYELTQKQRAGEREIRATKRELAGAEMLYEKSRSVGDLGEVARLKLRLQAQQKRMRDLVADNPKVLQRSPRREWAGDMPKVDVPKPCGRKVDELLDGKAAKAAMARAGVTKAETKKALAARLELQGAKLKDLPAMTARQQRDELNGAILDRKKLLPVEERRKRFKPANPAFLAARKKEVERNGGAISTGEDVTRYLNSRGADAANFGEVIMLREDATLSEILEEEFHFNQHRRGDYAECGQEEMRIRREIDAQKYLLDVAKRYKIPRIETEQTKAALAMYEEELRRLGE